MFKSAFIFSVLPLFVLAAPQDYGPPPDTSTTSTSAAPVAVPSAPPSTSSQINIDVAFQGSFIFNPANVTAPNGTMVTFFFPGGDIPHSVTQSTFADPCTPLTGSNGTGFDSGLTNSKQFTLQITDDTKPVWFFCKTPLHCGMGMVGSINAPSSGNTFDKYQTAAKAIGGSEATIQDNGPVTGGVGAVATAAPAATASPSASSSGSSGSSGSSSSDASRVMVSSGLALVAAAVAFVFAA